VRRTILLSMAFILPGLVLAACGGTTPTVTAKGGGSGGLMPCAPEDIQIPVMVTPGDRAHVEMASLTFYWIYNTTGCIPEEFEIQVSQTPTFDSYSGATLDVGEEHWSPPFGLLPATVYYWRMRGTVMAGPGPWSPTWSFYTGPACALVLLLAPEALFPSGYMFVYDAPSFEWTYPDETCVPEGYRLQASAAEDLASPVLDLVLASPSTLAVPIVDFNNCGVYHWRVAAMSGGTDGPYSTVNTFSVNAGASCTQECTVDQLIAPQPVSPAPYANVGTHPTEEFVGSLLQWWYPMPCFPDGFGIHLATTADFSAGNIGGGASPVTAAGGGWGPAVLLEPATQYYWEVFAGVGTTFGPSSPLRSFFTGPECAVPADSKPPRLLTPLDGATVDTLMPWMHWTAGAHSCIPDGYAVYLNKDEDFTGEDPYSSYGGIPATTLIPDPLDDCTTYYWKIAPILGGAELPASDVFSFTVRTGASCGLSQVIGKAIKDSACHYGPGIGWPILGYFVAGEQSPIAGTDMARRWYAVDNPDKPGQRCWVPLADFDAIGDVGKLRILNPPLTCTSSLGETDCKAAGGAWVVPPGAAAKLPPYCQCP
jgi:hypothetical protein